MISGNRRAGVYWDNATGTLDRTVVRDSLAMESDGRYGNGAQIITGADVTITDSLFVGNMTSGLAWSAARGTMERTIVRDSRPSTAGTHGVGVYVWSGTTLVGSDVTIRGCRIDANVEGAVGVGGSRAIIEDSALLASKPSSKALFGDGLMIAATLEGGETVLSSNVSMARTLVANNARAGVLVIGSAFSAHDSALLCNKLDLQVMEATGATASGTPIRKPFSLESSGIVGCGCGGTAVSCKGQASSIGPIPAPDFDG
ncbi:MAG: right-handed parallel beta-helix repeat-containing protein [Deltaproteobacteria bacterium]|nr:right-handed parallel beta-helix repeat-containing protein [Deltaproteobacteria bacterium]